MVRIAGLKRRQTTGLTVRSPDGLTIREQLELVTAADPGAGAAARRRVPQGRHAAAGGRRHPDRALGGPRRRRRAAAARVLPRPGVPGAHAAGGRPGAPLPLHQRPVAEPRGHRCATPTAASRTSPGSRCRTTCPGSCRSARPAETATFLPLEDLIAAHLPQLFPGLDVVSHHLFRVTRNADLEVEEDRDEDLLQALERELARRRFGPAVRLEVTETMDPQILEVLLSEMEMKPQDVLQVPGLLDLVGAVGALRPRPARAQGRAVRAGHPPAAVGGRDAEERLRHPARGRRAGPPPVPLVRDQRAAVHRAGRRRPERAGDQADALPHVAATPRSSTR